MKSFEKLREVLLKEAECGEFPDWLVPEAMAIADQPERYAESRGLVETLIAQIEDYDPYAGTGCFGGSVGIEAIRETMRRIVA